MRLLTYEQLLAMLPPDAETMCVSYADIEKALRLSRRTLYNERNDNSLLQPKFYVGATPYFDPQTVYEWYIDYTSKRLKKAA